MAPKVSVVMCVHNGETYLHEAVEGVLNQTFADFEFIIVDDASVDNTPAILQKYAAQDGRIRLIRNAHNVGLTRSLNKALRLARGQYIARQDADDISLPERFETQIQFLDENSEYALLGCSYYPIDETGKRHLPIKVLTDHSDIRRGLKKQNWFGHGCVMMRRDAVIQVGQYDETYEFAQDYDLWLRLAEAYKVANLAEPLYCWRATPSCISSGKKEEQMHYAHVAIAEAIKRERGKVYKPMVSVIVPTYNRPGMLKDNLQSILSQTYQDFEIMVVNDGGRDVEDVVERFNRDNKIVYIEHGTNRGLAAARNTAIRASNGKYIAYLDDDDLYYSEHLETLVTFLENNDYEVAYTDACRVQQERVIVKYVVTSKDIPYSFDFDYDRMLVQNLAPVLCFMHERSCLDEVGLFDETLSTHEDWDLWIRMSRQFKFAHIKKVTCEFTSRSDETNMTAERRADFLRTLEVIYKKYRAFSRGNPDVLDQQLLYCLNMLETTQALYSSRTWKVGRIGTAPWRILRGLLKALKRV